MEKLLVLHKAVLIFFVAVCSLACRGPSGRLAEADALSLVIPFADAMVEFTIQGDGLEAWSEKGDQLQAAISDIAEGEMVKGQDLSSVPGRRNLITHFLDRAGQVAAPELRLPSSFNIAAFKVDR